MGIFTAIAFCRITKGTTSSLCPNHLGGCYNYNESDDRDYPTFPKLVFENGKIKQLDFWLQPEKRVVWWNLPGWEVKYSQRQASTPTILNCQKR
ncbi:hypothetical protein [Nostoc sp.]|uniref:hypothetical protein n=1 Tax=Nostoc sp. TaxID=1180 RepID=UPI002FFA70AA